jgi:transposase InsO family protein
LVNTLTRDYAAVNPTPDAHTIVASLPRWIENYDERHPHSSLRMRSPRMHRREQALVE